MRQLLVITALAMTAIASVPARLQAQTTAADRALSREIFKQLIEIRTTEEDAATTRAAQAMADRLIAAGVPAADVHVFEPDAKTGCLVARLRGDGSGGKPILLMAHLDVVPARREDWSLDPFTFTERDGWFYGRGTSDNKAGVTALVANLIRLKREGWTPKRDVVIALSGDEETSGNSIQWLLAQHRDLIDAELALNTDAGNIILRNGKPTVFAVQASEKIYADYILEATDAGGHSSLPRPRNPIYILSAALDRIGSFHFPFDAGDVVRAFFSRSASLESGQLAADMRAVAAARPDAAAAERLSQSPLYNALLHTTCVATRVEAGHANNALPQFARATINCRILPSASPDAVEQTIRRLAGPDVAVTVRNQPVTSPPSPVPPEFLSRLERLVSAQWPGLPVVPYMETGATDGLFVRRAGIPTYAASAIAEDPDDTRAHGKDERIGVNVFYDAVEFWYRLIKAMA
jgi:acetylornithine deacetylase/succinyl-diaminopimelate desuccinylase-like protein